MPSTGTPALRWNSPSARTVASPKMPSMRPVSNPSVHRRCWSSATSSPRSMGVRRYKKRSPSRKPASTRVFQVCAPADPVDAQAAQALEGLHGGAGGRAEDAVGIDGRAREDGGQAVLDVGDRRSAVADGEGQAYR